MNDRGLLVGFYPTRALAVEAIREIRQRGFQRATLIRRMPDGSVQSGAAYSRRPLVWTAAGTLLGALLGALVGLAAARELALAAGLDVGAALLLATVAGGSVAWLLTRLLARRQRVDLAGTRLEPEGGWLVADETALVLQASPASLAAAIAILRRLGEAQPSVFAVHPPREYEPGQEPLQAAPLSIGQLEEHARYLATEHQIGVDTGRDEPLLRRLERSEQVIELVRRSLSDASRLEQNVSPAAEGLLDNTYIVQEHISDVRLNLPRRFYHELPVLTRSEGRGRSDASPGGEPRAYALAAEMVEHTDSQIDRACITAFLAAYQSVAPLKIGELWAMPLMVRMAIIERVRYLAEQVDRRVREREAADFWANRLLAAARRDPQRLFAVLAELSRGHPEPSTYFASQLTAHLYDEEAALVPVQSWLERTLHSPLTDLILREQTREAGTQVAIGNAITSLRQLSLLDWRDIVERLSRVERLLRDDPAGVYRSMDFDTRNRYRSAVEEIARGSSAGEVEVARRAVALAEAQPDAGSASSPLCHVGWYLIGPGRPQLAEQVGCRETRRHRILQWVYSHHTSLYLGAIALATAVLMLLVAVVHRSAALVPVATAAIALVALLPASQLAVQTVNYLVTRLLPPRGLPKMSFERAGIPDAFRTLVVVPMLLVDAETAREEIEKLEIRYLANPDMNLLFGLFADYADADSPHTAADEALLAVAVNGIEALNRRYGASRFYFLIREREWCASESLYLGWERKRGKLEELNALIVGEPVRGGAGVVKVGDAQQLTNVRFVITLDSDTQLPRDSARHLVETLAHPLNQPQYGVDDDGVDGSYAIIQPRVSTSLPSAVATPFSRLLTEPVGTDPYTRAVSDVYQDLAGEGSFVGKGIYDPRAFYRGLAGRFREQSLLSHDLIEGAHVRAGLASDIELFDEFPPDYMTYTRRQHRWIRGDWQIAEWCTPWVPSPAGGRVPNELSILNRWKIFDNLRRSLVPAGAVAYLVLAWLLSPFLAPVASALIAGLMLFHPTAQLATSAMSRGKQRVTLAQLRHSAARSVAEAALLPHQTGLAVDAILRVLYRRLVSRRLLLEWTPAQMAAWQAAGRTGAFLVNMGLASLFAAAVTAALWLHQPASLVPAAGFIALWLVSPLIGWQLSTLAKRPPRRAGLAENDLRTLRRIARRTWRYYDELVGPDTNWLPPDNYQVSHTSAVAMRTSPTNIGMWLLGALGAVDFGYLTADEAVARIGHSADTLARLERHEGHLLNWYDIGDLAPLQPRYVSTVDSGNLLGCLWVLEQGLLELLDGPPLGPATLAGLADTVGVLGEALAKNARYKARRPAVDDLARLFTGPAERAADVIACLRQAVEPVGLLARTLRSGDGADDEPAYWAGQLERQLGYWLAVVDGHLPWLEIVAQMPASIRADLDGAQRAALDQLLTAPPSYRALAAEGVVAAGALLAAHLGEAAATPADRVNPGNAMDPASLAGPADPANPVDPANPANPVDLADPAVQVWWAQLAGASQRSQIAARELVSRTESLISRGRELADGMNMRFLYDSERRLFRIGFNVEDQQLDGSLYDLLASEARLASFIAIARGEVPNEHWLAMGRPFGAVGGRRVLMSWSGTMFEYLMPLLLQRSYENSLLDMAAHQAVAAQIDYAQRRGVPWGISESAFGDLDANKTYQYKAFGVPGLGFKRGLDEDLVVAPYATMLALAVAPAAAVRNLARLAETGMYDQYGYYEALDFNRRPRREAERGVLVRAYMAHHQGMGFLAIDNLVCDGAMQRRFHADPRVVATQPLLYERVPVSQPLYHIPTREQPPERMGATETAPSVSKFDTPHTDSPKTQLLCNGSYTAMLTGSGGGYSQWGDFEITRWRADPTRDHWGTFCYIRDVDRGHVWSNAYQPLRVAAEEYGVRFFVDRGEIRRRDHGIDTETEAIVSTEDDAEIRRITLINRTARTRRLEVTSYAELALAPHNTDRQHPAFNKLFVQTEADLERGVLLAYRRLRHPDEAPIFVAHRLTPAAGPSEPLQFETDRARFLGRGRTAESPAALDGPLSNTDGHVLDPVFSLRRAVVLKPGQRLSVSLVMAAAESRAAVLALMDKYDDEPAIGRALDLAWARSQLELRQLRIQPDEARRFQQLASFMLYPTARLRPPADRLEQNRRDQSGLWAYGISGDLPIAVVMIGESRDIGVVREMLQAHTYWRHHGLKADLVILNEAGGGYDRPLREQLGRLVHGHSMYTGIDQPGGVFLRDADQIPDEDVTLMLAVARVALVAARGPLAQQLGVPGDAPELPEPMPARRMREEPSSPLPYLELSHANGLGGFTPDGREYVIQVGGDEWTPAPWVNVIANPEFGTLVSEAGSGFTWYGNSQRNRLTPWSNDPVTDPPAEAIYIRDEESGRFWTPTPLPVRETEGYRVRHGAGYSVFEHNSHAIEQELTVFVPVDDDGGEPVRIQHLRLHNDSPQSRHLSVTFYAELVLGETREASMAQLVTRWDAASRVMLAWNRYNGDYGDRVLFAALSPAATAHSADRGTFLGRNGTLADPAAMRQVGLRGRHGAGLDSCVALQVRLDLAPGQRAGVTCLFGQASSSDEAARLVAKYGETVAVEESLAATREWWDRRLGILEVELPEPPTAYLVNRWLLYQTLACRIWGRSGLYQSGGAYGFRDQLQDVMALLYAAPDLARAHILLAARHQFREGDVQHWWHPPTGAGVRTRISDDLLWLPYAVARYVEVTGDATILDERLPFVEARLLEDRETEAYVVPAQSVEHAPLWEHCRRAIERGSTTGPHGLPLIGSGDWNDGLNRVGAEGHGESVWLAWFLVDTLNRFAELATTRDRRQDAADWRERATRLTEIVESQGWDGAWYRRAYFDDGTSLGSAASPEAKIDSLPQSWAWLSGAADRARAAQALESAWQELVLEDDQLALLFSPPFDLWDKDPGYIKGYPPGVRENGGQYTHAAVWLAMALARSGDGQRTARLLEMLSPIEHALDAATARQYMVEPYVVAADVYRLPGRIGQGGWSWYTGSAGWMYRAWIEEVLGLKVRGWTLAVDPVIPPAWPGFTVRYRRGEAIYEIVVENPGGVARGVEWLELDGRRLDERTIPLEDAPIKHKLRVRLGGGSSAGEG